MKDFALLVATALILLCSSIVFKQRKYAKRREEAMQRELEALQIAEEALANMRKRLDDAEQLKQSVLQEKNLLELKLKLRDRVSKQEEADRARKESLQHAGGEDPRETIAQLQDEVGQLINALRQAEVQLEASQYSSSDLQFWLQLTYELELEHFNAKKRLAESQFQQVKDSCEKIRKRRNAFLGSMRIAHGDILSNVDERIAEARRTLEEVISDASERAVRWSHIQRACSFEIVANPGLQSLLAQERNRLANLPALNSANVNQLSNVSNSSNGASALPDSASANIYAFRAMQSSGTLANLFNLPSTNANAANAAAPPNYCTFFFFFLLLYFPSIFC